MWRELFGRSCFLFRSCALVLSGSSLSSLSLKVSNFETSASKYDADMITASDVV
jgi:hypothetical protein